LDEGAELLDLLDAHRRSVRDTPDGSAAGAQRRFIDSMVPEPDEKTVRLEPGNPTSSVRVELTEREEEILVMLGNSMTNAEIAAATFVTQDTVKYHLKNIYAKVGARNRIHALRIAQQRGYC
jgi:LuxR family maltose regulon positive regulatory protein